MKKNFKVLFLSTGNACRSIIAEAVLRKLGGDAFTPYSAGSFPVNHVNLKTVTLLQDKGYETDSLYSKSWAEFDGKSDIDIVITVCDTTSEEECPVWFGDAIKVHWNTEDPSVFLGNDAAIQSEFEKTLSRFEKQIGALISLPLDKLSKDACEEELKKIDEHVAVMAQ